MIKSSTFTAKEKGKTTTSKLPGDWLKRIPIKDVRICERCGKTQPRPYLGMFYGYCVYCGKKLRRV